MIDYLSMFDVCRLAQTCRSLSKITNDTRFNDYWKNRQNRIFNGLVENNGFYKFKCKKKSLLWFDVYQWGVITKTQQRDNTKRLKRGKIVFSSWLKCKRIDLPKTFNLNVFYAYQALPYLEKTFEFPISSVVSSTLEIPFTLVTIDILILYLKPYFLHNFKTIQPNDKRCVFNVPDDILSILGLGRRKTQDCSCPYYYLHSGNNYYKRYTNPDDCFKDDSINQCK